VENINGKTSFIFKEIWVFPNLNGILPFIFQTDEESKFKGFEKDKSRSGGLRIGNIF
jgi:hypothetical protein